MDFESGSVSWLLKTYGAKTILAVLSKYPGNKDLIVCPTLIPILDMLISFSTLKNNGVSKVHMLVDGILPGVTSKRLYLMNDSIKTTKIVANQVNSYMQNKTKCDLQIVLVYVPRLLKICDALLEGEGIYGYVETIGCPLGFIPMDYDFFILRQDSMFKSFFIDSDQSHIFNISIALQQLQQLIGPIKNIHAIGKYSKMCLKVLENLKCENVNNETVIQKNLIDNMLIVDRDVDYISTLLSQLSYEGLLDDIFGKQCYKVSLPENVLQRKKITVDRKNKLVIPNSDSVFRDIRDLHLSTAFTVLKRTGQDLKNKQLERENMNITQMAEFVSKKLSAVKNQQKSLETHINICEIILEQKKENDFVQQLNIERNLVEGVELKDCFNYIQKLIIKQHCPYSVLRLMCLYSITQDGLNYKDYFYLIKLYLQSYGHEHIYTMHILRKLELLYESNLNQNNALSLVSNTAGTLNSTLAAAITSFPRSSQMRNLIRKFSLLSFKNQNQNLNNPNDPSFVFGGNYIPLVCRFIEYLFINKPVNFDELIKLLNFPMQTKVNHSNQKRTSISGISNSTSNNGQSIQLNQKNKIILVLFVGGVTYAEISALRFLAKSTGYKIFIASTGSINGNQLLKHTVLEFL